MLMVGGGGSVITTANGAELVAGVVALSVTVTVKVNEPVVVGVPVSVPSDPTVRPGGTPAEALHLSGR